MKNGSNEILESKIAERNERAKKLYRYISDVARRIDEATASCRSIADLFANHLEVQRQKLRDNCEKLIFLDSLNYGKKSLELLWRKVYYETVAAAKKLHISDNDYDSYLFTHLVCGVGHFHNIIMRIESDMKINFKEMDYIPLYKDEETDEINNLSSDDELQFGRSALHSCLIYLGDLSRYQAEIFHTFEPSIAARYYLQAAHIDMSSGMPYNQLGNLYLDKNHNLDSVCYYIHCLSCKTPFEGAMGNLTKIFEKNTQFLDTLINSEPSTQVEHIQNIMANFLSLIEIWYFGKNDDSIPQRCNTIALELKIAMSFETNLPDINKNYEEHIQAIEEENINPSYLNGNLVHKIVQICLFTLGKIIETDEKQAFACKAFTLALLSQLLQKMLIQLESIGLKNPAHKYNPKIPSTHNSESDKTEDQPQPVNVEIDTPISNGKGSHDELSTKESDDDSKKLQNGDVKNNSKKALAKRRRRRRIISSESSDTSDGETESSEVDINESLSEEEEEMSDSTCHSDNDTESGNSQYNSDDEENKETNRDVDENQKMKKINKNSPSHEDTQKDEHIHEKTETNSKEIVLNAAELQRFLFGDNFLPSIKLLQDWILTEKDLILSCGDSGEALFQCVVDLLNIFVHNFIYKNNEKMGKEYKILEYVRNVAKNLKLEYKTIPLPEDVNLRGTYICKFDKDASEWQILDRYKPSVYEENVIRILNFIDFGNQIAKIVPQIRFNRTLRIFYLKKVAPPKLNTKINHKRSREWHNSKKQHPESSEGGLLRRLGRLWLASRVRELERSGQAPAPALLALDAAALYKHLRRVKQLMRARNFIMLVPTVVLQELDDLKREMSTARDAIRWLEIQLRSGSRFLRAQRLGQSKPLPLIKYPRKAPPHVHNFIQILEFCNHFVADEKPTQGGNGDPDNSLHGKSTPLLVLLTGNELGNEEEQYKEFSLMGAAHASGISVKYIGDFYTKWRQSMHKSGKKR